MSIRRACALCQQNRYGEYKKRKTKALDAPLKARLNESASIRIRFKEDGLKLRIIGVRDIVAQQNI